MAKTYNTISTFTAGQVLTAAEMNELGENSNNYRVPPMCKVKRSGDLNPYTNNTVIAWNDEDYDTDTMHDNSTNPSRITCNTAGVYVVHFGLFVAFSGTATGINVEIKKNGTTFSFSTIVSISKTTDYLGEFSGVAEAAVNDYFEVSISVASATSPIIKADARSWFAVNWLGQVS